MVTAVEGLSLSVSAETRRVAAFPADVEERLRTAVARDSPYARTLAWLGRGVSMRGKEKPRAS